MKKVTERFEVREPGRGRVIGVGGTMKEAQRIAREDARTSPHREYVIACIRDVRTGIQKRGSVHRPVVRTCLYSTKTGILREAAGPMTEGDVKDVASKMDIVRPGGRGRPGRMNGLRELDEARDLKDLGGLREKRAGRADDIAEEAASELQRRGTRMGMDRIYSPGDGGVHFDLAGGGHTLWLDADDPMTPNIVGIGDVQVTGEGPMEFWDALDSLKGHAYYTDGRRLANDIIDVIQDAMDDLDEKYPERVREIDGSIPVSGGRGAKMAARPGDDELMDELNSEDTDKLIMEAEAERERRREIANDDAWDEEQMTLPGVGRGRRDAAVKRANWMLGLLQGSSIEARRKTADFGMDPFSSDAGIVIDLSDALDMVEPPSLKDRAKDSADVRLDIEDEIRELKDQVDELVEDAEMRGFRIQTDDEIEEDLTVENPYEAPPSPVERGLVPTQINETGRPVITQKGS